MTQPDFRTEATGAGLVGHVTYRCAGCGRLITERVAFVSPDYTITGTLPQGLELDDQTRTYHPHCIPKEI